MCTQCAQCAAGQRGLIVNDKMSWQGELVNIIQFQMFCSRLRHSFKEISKKIANHGKLSGGANLESGKSLVADLFGNRLLLKAAKISN